MLTRKAFIIKTYFLLSTIALLNPNVAVPPKMARRLTNATWSMAPTQYNRPDNTTKTAPMYVLYPFNENIIIILFT